MNLTERDRRALIGLGIAVVLVLVWLWTSPATPDTAAASAYSAADSIPMAERRLAKLRQVAAAVPGKQQVLDQVSGELAQRERGILRAESAQQAQAQVMQILRKAAQAQQQRIDFKNVELGQVRPFGDQYGEVLVSVSFDAGIEQLLQLMVDLTAQRELIATNEMRIGVAHMKEKKIPVRLTVSGIVPKSLIPAKRGAASF